MARKLESDIRAANKRLSSIESLLEVIESRMTLMASNDKRRAEAFSQALGELERDFREHKLSQSQSLEEMAEKFRDQKVKEGQIEMMVERFNNTLSQFENKLSVLQKVLSEKDLNLLSYRKIMEQIIDEVETLKFTHGQPTL